MSTKPSDKDQALQIYTAYTGLLVHHLLLCDDEYKAEW